MPPSCLPKLCDSLRGPKCSCEAALPSQCLESRREESYEFEKLQKGEKSAELDRVSGQKAIDTDFTIMDLKDEEVDRLLLELLQSSLVCNSRPKEKDEYDPCRKLPARSMEAVWNSRPKEQDEYDPCRKLPFRCMEPPKMFLRKTIERGVPQAHTPATNTSMWCT